MNAVNLGVTFPEDLLECLDQIRGDIPRSIFFQRMFEEKYADTPCVKKYLSMVKVARK